MCAGQIFECGVRREVTPPRLIDEIDAILRRADRALDVYRKSQSARGSA